MKELLETLLEEFQEIHQAMENSVPRAPSFPEAPNMIQMATGIRRSGKYLFPLSDDTKIDERRRAKRAHPLHQL